MVKRRRELVSVELDAAVVARLDELAASYHESRTQLIERACADFAKHSRTTEETAADDAKYEEAYRLSPEQPAYGNVAYLAELLAKDEW
jgi:predicted transcriptional regulator